MKNKSIFSLIFSVICITTFTITIGIFFLFSERFKYDEEGLLKKISSQINQTIIEKTTNYLYPAILVSEISSSLVYNAGLDINDFNQIERYLLAQIKAYPQLSQLYIGKENGDFLMVSRDSKNQLSSKRVNQKTKSEIIKIYNENGGVTQTKQQVSSYDPRKRKWYFNTKQKETQLWTDLYMFFSGKRPGITASYPVTNKDSEFLGVFGVDLELSEISEFLSFQKKYYQSKVIILNYKNEIVAQSGNLVFKTLQDGSVNPLHIKEHDDEVIKEAYATILDKKLQSNSSITIKVNNSSYLLSTLDFPDYIGKHWKVMSLLPKNKLNEARIPINIVFYLIILIISVAGLVIAIFVSRMISVPIKELSFDMQRLKYQNVDGKQIRSSIIEVNELVQNYSVIKKLFSQTFKK